MGQKRNFAKKFIKELEHFNDNSIFIDLFGGSGILSHLTKQNKPNSKVIYNDYDNFMKRINSVETTTEIIEYSRSIFLDYKKGDRISTQDKTVALKFIKQIQDKYGYVDYITLSSQLLFSGKYVKNYKDLAKETWYYKLRKVPIEIDGYLEEVEVVSMDYRELFKKFKNNSKAVFIIDPPYFQTQSNGYKNTWNIQQHLDCLNVLSIDRFFYFTSSKSGIIEVLQWFEDNGYKSSPFNNCVRISHKQSVNYNSSYEDIMFVKS